MLFIYSFYALVAFCGLLYFYTRAKTTTTDDANFRSFQRSYLTVYLLAAAGDWLQGPHVYALYESYGMTKHQIEILFIAGFGSSMIFGTFIGSIADKYGRKTNCFIYGVLYGGACITKHFADFNILMVGRLLGGIATSILYSAFESWLVYEHTNRGFGEDLLSTIFSHAVLGNSVVAIVAGVAAQYAADLFGFVAPFDLSMTVLAIMCVLIVFTWPENYGNQKAAISKSFVDAWKGLMSDRKILCLGVIQSLFEGSMYTFVLEWTPALTQAAAVSEESTAIADINAEGHRGVIPHGYVFAGFMVAIMIGSSLFKLLSKFTRPESFMRVVLLVSALMLYAPCLFPNNQNVIFGAFIIFEVSVGLFWPSLGFMRGIYVPESTRATTMNFFRVPLNLIVVGILLQNLPMTVIFQCCVGFLLLAAVCQHWLYKLAVLTHFKGTVINGGLGKSQDHFNVPSQPEEVKIPLRDPDSDEEVLMISKEKSAEDEGAPVHKSETSEA